MLRILVIEDNKLDVLVIEEVLRELKPSVILDVCENGEQAIEYMREHIIHKPSLIFLDLNIPGKSGKEVLRDMRLNRYFGSIPVVVLTGSSSPYDAADVYRLGANCFHTKPTNLDDFIELVLSIFNFWLTKTDLPSNIDFVTR